MKIIKNKIRAYMRSWCLKNFPLEETTVTTNINAIFVKKGRIREWRFYDDDFNRIEIVKPD